MKRSVLLISRIRSLISKPQICYNMPLSFRQVRSPGRPLFVKLWGRGGPVGLGGLLNGGVSGGHGVVSVHLQPGPGDGGECAVAVVRTLRRRPEREGDAGLCHTEVQGIRIRHHDQL